MASLIFLKPATPVAAVIASTGTGGANLGTPDPKEVWASTAAGATADLKFDFGAAPPALDSVFVGFIGGAGAPLVRWSGGNATHFDTIYSASAAIKAASDVAA